MVLCSGCDCYYFYSKQVYRPAFLQIMYQTCTVCLVSFPRYSQILVDRDFVDANLYSTSLTTVILTNECAIEMKNQMHRETDCGSTSILCMRIAINRNKSVVLHAKAVSALTVVLTHCSTTHKRYESSRRTSGNSS